MKNFCVDGSLTNPKCYSTESFDFSSEEQIFDILLDVLKSEVPTRLKQVNGCDDKPMYISEEDIDLIPSGNQNARFSIILNPVGDFPEYSDSLMFRTVIYNFELILAVVNESLGCVTWELLRFKNVIEGLIIGTQFAIDGYNSVLVEPRGFNYIIPEPIAAGTYRRQGAYRFSVTVTQTRK